MELRRILHRNHDTAFGRTHRFGSLRTIRDFQNAVPISSYDDYRAAIARIADGEEKVLTAERICLFEPTGGSSGGEKLIPYNPTLRQSFHRTIKLWIADLFRHRPAVRRGRAYWSISPLSQNARRTSGGIPIGFDDDTAYLSHVERLFVRKTMVAPRELALVPSIEAAQYATLFFLLRSRDLSLISVWSPTFLSELFRLLWSRLDDLCNDISRGSIPQSAAGGACELISAQYPADIQRAEFLRRTIRSASLLADCIRDIWPSLALVSCWTDGPSYVHANSLRQDLAGIEVQGKGLLATEAFVTVPLTNLPAPALAIRSHFFEFQPADSLAASSAEVPLLAEELSIGRRYRVIVTTGGGLYRYQLHDEVEVVEYFEGVPLLRFLGKTDETSDLVGEKLNAAHVESVLRSAYRELSITVTFARFRAEQSSPPRYVLQLAALKMEDTATLLQQLPQIVDAGLRKNIAYDYARELGQLGSPTVELLSPDQVTLLQTSHFARGTNLGQRLGDIKPATFEMHAPAKS